MSSARSGPAAHRRRLGQQRPACLGGEGHGGRRIAGTVADDHEAALGPVELQCGQAGGRIRGHGRPGPRRAVRAAVQRLMPVGRTGAGGCARRLGRVDEIGHQGLAQRPLR